jgi:hypothetical protein
MKDTSTISGRTPPHAARFWLATIAMGALPFAVAGTCPASDVAAWVEILRDPLLVQHVYPHDARTAAHAPAGGPGSVNADWQAGRRPDWFIEAQRAGGDWIQAGLLGGHPAAVRKGVDAIEWGFARQADDGSFPGTGDPYHSVSLFLEAAARAAIIARDVGPGASAVPVAAWRPRIGRSARWYLSPDVREKGWGGSLVPFGHRYFLRAEALALAGALEDDADLHAEAARYVKAGLALQRDDGVLPERDGFDLGYQAVALRSAGRHWFVCPDELVRRDLATLISASTDLFLDRIAEDGSLDLRDSSRHPHERARSGRAKTVSRGLLVEAFLLGRKVTGDERYGVLAARAAREPPDRP